MPFHHGDAFFEAGFGRQFACGKKVGDVPENPRVIERAATDADRGAAGAIEHHLRGLWRRDVAVANHGRAFQRLHDGADAGEVHRAAETLLSGASVDRDGGDAGIFEGASEVGRGEVFIVPAEPHFGGDGDFHGADHQADESRGFGVIGHHGGAATVLANFADRTTHVDVHGTHTERFEQRGGIAHLFGHGTKQLDGERTVCWPGLDELERFAILLQERAGVDEIGGAEADPADFANDETEGQVGVAGERRQEQIGIERQLAKGERHEPMNRAF